MASRKKSGNTVGAVRRLAEPIAQELGLDSKVMESGWRSLTAKESGRIGGLMTKRKREIKSQALREE